MNGDPASAFTVVIAAHDAEAFIGRAVASALRAGFGRVLVVDDGSADRTLEAAREAGARTIHQANTGAAGARNRGIDAAGDGHILFLDADDELLPGAGGAIIAALDNCPDAAAVVGGHVQVGAAPDRERLPEQRWIAAGRLDRPCVVLGTSHVFCTTGLTLTPPVIRAGLRFNPALRFAEDRDVLYRASRLGPIAVTGRLLVRKHDAPGQMTASPAQVRRWLADQLLLAQMHGGPEADAGARAELALACSWVLKNTCRVLAGAGDSLSAEEWDQAAAVFGQEGWRVPRSAMKWRAIGRLRGRVRLRRRLQE